MDVGLVLAGHVGLFGVAVMKIQAMAQGQALAGGQVVVALAFLAGGAEIAPWPAGGAAGFFVLRIK